MLLREQFVYSENIKASYSMWQQKLTGLREQASNIIVNGVAIGKLSAIVALAGIMNWCPRCGEWQGEGSEGRGSGAPASPKTPPIPPHILKAVSTPIDYPPTPREDLPGNRNAKLTRTSGVLETYGTHNGSPAKYRSWQPAKGHGRKVDIYRDGDPEPDSQPHAHEAQFIRGDGYTIPLYEREPASQPTYDSGVHVSYDEQSHVYTWTLKYSGDKTDE